MPPEGEDLSNHICLQSLALDRRIVPLSNFSGDFPSNPSLQLNETWEIVQHPPLRDDTLDKLIPHSMRETPTPPPRSGRGTSSNPSPASRGGHSQTPPPQPRRGLGEDYFSNPSPALRGRIKEGAERADSTEKSRWSFTALPSIPSHSVGGEFVSEPSRKWVGRLGVDLSASGREIVGGLSHRRCGVSG